MTGTRASSYLSADYLTDDCRRFQTADEIRRHAAEVEQKKMDRDFWRDNERKAYGRIHEGGSAK